MAADLPTAAVDPQRLIARPQRWRWGEAVFWLALLLPYVLTPTYLSLASQVAIAALFALSLDLILGYAGIISLGHAAFFGVGAYPAAPARHLHHRRLLRRCCRRAPRPDHPVGGAGGRELPALGGGADHAGAGRHRPALWRHRRRHHLLGGAGPARGHESAVLVL